MINCIDSPRYTGISRHERPGGRGRGHKKTSPAFGRGGSMFIGPGGLVGLPVAGYELGYSPSMGLCMGSFLMVISPVFTSYLEMAKQNQLLSSRSGKSDL